MSKMKRIPADKVPEYEEMLGMRIVQPTMLSNIIRMLLGRPPMPIAFIPPYITQE